MFGGFRRHKSATTRFHGTTVIFCQIAFWARQPHFIAHTIVVGFLERVQNTLDRIDKICYRPFLVFLIGVTEMRFYKLSLLLLCSFVLFATGCKTSGAKSAKPSNPFAQNQQTVPPPATFSSQESYLGQTPGSFVPQTPAETFPTSATQPADNNVSGEKAMLFSATAAEKETGWVPVEVASTSQTAFQAMESKVSSVSSNDNGILKTATGVSESLVVGTSHVVTTITEEPQSAATLTEPSLLYSGKYAE